MAALDTLRRVAGELGPQAERLRQLAFDEQNDAAVRVAAAAVLVRQPAPPAGLAALLSGLLDSSDDPPVCRAAVEAPGQPGREGGRSCPDPGETVGP